MTIRFLIRSGALALWGLSLATVSAQTAGVSYGVIVGISQYEDIRAVEWLKYATRDARLFEGHLKSPRGGGVSGLYTLLDDRATQARVMEVLRTVLTVKAGPQDQVFLFFSGRGFATPESRHGFLFAADSRRERALTSAIKVEDVLRLIQQSRARRVVIFADVCREPSDVSRNNLINLKLRELGGPGRPVQAFLASQPKQLSKEDEHLEGGHGVFSYYLVKGLQSNAADSNRDGEVSVQELFSYLEKQVTQATKSAQAPLLVGQSDPSAQLSDLRKAGMPASISSRGGFGGRPLPLFASSVWLPGVLAMFAPFQQAGALQSAFEAARDRGSLFGPGGAVELFRRLSAAQQAELAGDLAAALEEKGQQILVRYGEGDHFANDPFRLQKADFDLAGDFFESAEALRSGGSAEETRIRASLEARKLFARGRALMYTNTAGAVDGLQRSIRIDAELAESRNALGIAYFEQADYAGATRSFQQALAAAPDWAYARHNLALSLIESGNYQAAEREYREAIRRTPYYPYLYYNLGFLYHRVNRKSEAERQYSRALTEFDRVAERYQARAQTWTATGKTEEAARTIERVRVLKLNRAEVHNSLGALRQAQGKLRDSEREYRLGIEANPDLNSARHNLASLKMEEARNRVDAPEFTEALELWREAIRRDAGYLPSRLKLAEALTRQGNFDAAVEQYRAALAQRPGSPAVQARLDETLGDMLAARGDRAAAREHYRAALEHTEGPAAKKALERKLSGIR